MILVLGWEILVTTCTRTYKGFAEWDPLLYIRVVVIVCVRVYLTETLIKRIGTVIVALNSVCACVCLVSPSI